MVRGRRRCDGTVMHPSSPARVRVCALLAPVLLLLYGLLRLVDGLDGDHGPGIAWNVGHALFFAGIVLFGLLAVGLRGLLPDDSARQRLLGNVATVVALFGVACFLWVILGDLFAGFGDAAPLPDPLMSFGPLMLQAGLLVLLVMLVVLRPRRLPAWAPALVLVGFLCIPVSLDLLPVGALLVLAGLSPLARRRPGSVPGPAAVDHA